MNGNPNVPHGSDYQSLLNYRFQLAHKGNGLLDRGRVAMMIGIQDNTLYKHAAGLLPTSADFARGLIAAAVKIYPDELEFMSFFIPEGYRIIRDGKLTGIEKPETLAGALAATTKELSHVQSALVDGAKDGSYDKADKKTIRREIAELKQLLSEIDASLDAEVKK